MQKLKSHLNVIHIGTSYYRKPMENTLQCSLKGEGKGGGLCGLNSQTKKFTRFLLL